MSNDVLDSTAAGGMVIRGGATRVGGYLVGTLVSLVGIALVARHLGPSPFGRFQTVASLLAAVGAVTDAGLATLGLREYTQRNPDERHRMLGTLLGLRIALSLVGTVVALAFAVLAGYEGTLILGAALQGLGLVLTVWQTTLTIPLQVELRLVSVSLLDLVRQVATTAGYAALIAGGAGTVLGFLAVPVPVGILVAVGAAWLVRRSLVLPRVDFAAWRGLLRVSAAFVVASSVGTLYIYAAMLCMGLVASDHEVGLFAASFRVLIVVAGVPGLLVTAAFPLLSRTAKSDSDRFGYAVSRVEETTMLLGVAACVVAFAGANAIIEVAAGNEFAGAADVLRIHSVSILATFTATTAGFALLSLHLHRALLVCNLISFTASTTLVLVLGHRGAQGGAVASAVGETLLAAGYFIALKRADVGVVPSVRTLVGALASGAVAIAIGQLSALPSVFRAAVAVAVYGVLVLALRIVPRELLELVPSRRRA